MFEMGTFREALCPTEALIWFWRCLSSFFVEKPWKSNLLITCILLKMGQASPGHFSHTGTSIPIGSAGCSGSLFEARHLNAFVTLTFTLSYNFTSDFLTKISHKGEQLVPITRKAFATWVTAHKKHSWDHQLFYLFFLPISADWEAHEIHLISLQIPREAVVRQSFSILLWAMLVVQHC